LAPPLTLGCLNKNSDVPAPSEDLLAPNPSVLIAASSGPTGSTHISMPVKPTPAFTSTFHSSTYSYWSPIGFVRSPVGMPKSNRSPVRILESTRTPVGILLEFNNF